MMDMQTIGMIFAGLGVLATIGYLILGVKGLDLLRQIRDRGKNS